MMAAEKCFQVVHINIRGIRSNSANLQQYLEQHKYPDIVTINESKLNNDQAFSLPFYDCVASRGSRPYGSLILKRKDILDVSAIETLNRFKEEVIGIRVNGNSLRPSLNIVTFYNPPNTPVNPAIICAISRLSGKTLLTGDFNSKNVAWGSTKNDSHGDALLREINDRNLLILNNGAKTRYDPTNGNEQVLDLMLSNHAMAQNFVSWTVDEDVGSDHYPIRANFNFGNIRQPAQSYRNIKDTDWEYFRETLKDLPLPQPTNADELDNAVQELTLQIVDAYKLACPEKRNKHPNSRPFSAEMITLVKEKRKLRRQKAAAKGNGDTMRVANLQREINRKNNELKRHQRNLHRERILKQCHELNKEKDSGRFFKLFQTIAGKNNLPSTSCQISDGDTIASTDEEKARLFAKRLERLHKIRNDASFNQEWRNTVEAHVRENANYFEVDRDETYDDYETGDETPVMSKITKEEIIEQLKRCKNKSAAGSDGLNYQILKKLPPNVFQIITALFNKAFSLGHFAQAWKHANVKMVPKPGKNKNEAKNWRPISLLSCLGKLFERVVTNRLSQYLESKKLLSPFQSGFRRGRMTAEQLVRLSEDAHSSLKRKGITAALFLDAEAAFDQAWHDGIRFKVKQLGIPTRLVRLISSFLSKRTLTVKIGDKTSNTVNMEAGTPQGACLSPLLYIILVNDIPNVGPNANIGQFADDISLWANALTFSGSQRYLQKAVDVVEGWCRRWRIKLNGAKSSLIYFHRLRDQPSEDLSLQLFNEIIRPTSSAKYLGIEFDSKLTFQTHIQTIEKKSSSRLNVFKLLTKNGVNNSVLIRLFKTYVRPLFEYGSISFLTANIKRLQLTQNEFLRLSLKLPRYLRTDLIHEAAGLELIEQRLLDVNQRLLPKMIEHEAVREIVQRSKSVIALNNYKTPIDKLC